jgi:hypothetical protein
LPGDGAARVGQLLRWAHAQRAGRFSPGALRTPAVAQARAGWGWLACVLWTAARLWGMA